MSRPTVEEIRSNTEGNLLDARLFEAIIETPDENLATAFRIRTHRVEQDIYKIEQGIGGNSALEMHVYQFSDQFIKLRDLKGIETVKIRIFDPSSGEVFDETVYLGKFIGMRQLFDHTENKPLVTSFLFTVYSYA